MKKIVGIIITIVMVMSLCLAIAACQSDCDQGNHTWDEGTITKQATCTAEGEKTYKCQNCDETKVEKIAKIAHTAVANDAANKEATCTEAGLSGATKCSVCGTAINAGTAIPAKGHTVATWTDAGEGKHSGTCSVCEETITENHVDADENNVCDKCEAELSTVEPEDPCKDGHTVATWTDAENGKHSGVCSVCEETITEDHIDADENEVCDKCESSLAEEPEDPCKDGHTWDEGTVTTPATCTTKGEKTYHCTVCEDGVKTEEIEMIDHTYVDDDEVNTPATCTEDGIEGAQVCSECGNKVAGTKVEATGHHIDETTGLCSGCGKAIVTIDETELTLSIDNTTATLTATASNGAEITWTSSAAATVSVANGVLTAKKPGTVTITASVENGISATCEVTVADAWYIIGGQDSTWGKVAAFGVANKPYFHATETEGIYKTDSIELGKKAEFQIALVGRTDNNWWQVAYNKNYNSTDAANVLKTVGDSNFQVEKHGKYTITLDLTGATAVVSGVLDEDLSGGEETVDMYYLIGAMNGWSTAATNEAAGDYLFTYDEETETYSLTVKLTKGQEFKVALVGMAWNGALGESALPRTLIGTKNTATADKSYQIEWTSSDNMGVGVTGWYTFTIDPDGGTNNVLTYTFSETDPSLEVEPELPETDPAE